jgi:hypothetical protein
MQNREVIAIVATLGLHLSVGALKTLYSQNTFGQIFNTGSANAGISGAVAASSGTGSYDSNGGFVLGGSTGQSGAGGGSSVC